MSTKQRMMSAADLQRLDGVPHEAWPTATWLWLNLDPLGRGLMDPEWIAEAMHPRHDPLVMAETILEHLVMLIDAGFLTTYQANGCEWILLLHPLKVDMRGVRIETPEPPTDRPWTSVAVGGGGARAGAGAREWAREVVRAEDAARAEAWDAVARDREVVPERPERPILLDAPPMFCPDHMPYGAGKKKCGPCRDVRLLRDEWIQRKRYEDRMEEFYERAGDQPDADTKPW